MLITSVFGGRGLLVVQEPKAGRAYAAWHWPRLSETVFPFFALFFKLSFLCWINWTFHKIFFIRFSAYYLHSYTTVLVIIGFPYVPWRFCLRHFMYTYIYLYIPSSLHGLVVCQRQARHPFHFRKELTFLRYHLLKDQLSPWMKESCIRARLVHLTTDFTFPETEIPSTRCSSCSSSSFSSCSSPSFSSSPSLLLFIFYWSPYPCSFS